MSKHLIRDLLLLVCVEAGCTYGLQIRAEYERRTKETLGFSALYPALRRLTGNKLLEAGERFRSGNSFIQPYQITPSGRKLLSRMREMLKR